MVLFMVGLTASAALLPSQPSVLRSAKNGQAWTIKSIDYPKMLAPAIAVPWIGGTVAAGALPAVFVVKNLNPWYKNLAKPTWSPPDKLFAPVWSTLYALIGLSCALVLGSNPRALPKPFLAYVINATLNLGWAPVFFGLHRIRAGFFVSCGLLGTACWTALEFRKAANAALPALLLLPYIAWLTFATVLNAKLWQLNGASK
jgi:tryptophan-rich sensory protein